MENPLRKIILALMVVVMSILACTINLGGPEYPSPAIPISTDSLADLQSGMSTAVAGAAVADTITLVFTEEQLTSYLYYWFQSQANPLISNPQVYLREGQMRIHGTASKGTFEAYVYIVVTAQPDDQGHMQINIDSADFGPLPVPDGLKTAFSAVIAEAYIGALGPVASGFRLESVQIQNGTMTLIGRIK